MAVFVSRSSQPLFQRLMDKDIDFVNYWQVVSRTQVFYMFYDQLLLPTMASSISQQNDALARIHIPLFTELVQTQRIAGKTVVEHILGNSL
jgi:membrane-anchored glycerophosphoryl diester phosphodiesterase (GDPDase)